LAFVRTGLLLIPLVMLRRLDETARQPLPDAVAAGGQARGAANTP
jgi:hypothetical protein